MKIKWGMMMTDGRGKLGGQVASKNRSGAYVRTKVTPVNPRTSYQSAVRQNLAVISKSWDLLTEKLRDSWNAAANSGEWNRTDIFGDSRKPTGKNLFTSINLVSQRTTNTGILDVPAKAGFGVSNTLTFNTVFVAEGVEPVMELGVAVSGDITAGTRFEVQATPPVSAGRSYFENDYRFISATNQVTEGNQTLEIGTQWFNKFGNISEAQVGSKISVRYRQVLNGQVTPWQSTVAIIANATP